MKRISSLLLVIAFTGVILLPVTSTVNTTFSNEIHTADNTNGPVPPLPPCAVEAPATSFQV
jgi:hypothetical protein